ncbi:MAG: hypothetical protein BWY92_00291 [Firmicutes bacterium ADurb.BinA052]|nr:MAG: hypothetical protein BWY92_00291 [Firmicutes bacterium ADurb.BinA052]
MPVLSEHMTSALPSVSTAGRWRMIAFLAAIRCTPMAMTMVTIAGSPSGIAATAKLTAVRNMSKAPSPRARPAMNTPAHMSSAAIPSFLPRISSLRWSGVVSCSASWSMAAILPIWVDIPVAATTATPRP